METNKPKTKRTYMAEVDKVRLDLVCDMCGRAMDYVKPYSFPFFDESGETNMYYYTCSPCDFHRLERHHYPIFISGKVARE